MIPENSKQAGQICFVTFVFGLFVTFSACFLNPYLIIPSFVVTLFSLVSSVNFASGKWKIEKEVKG